MRICLTNLQLLKYELSLPKGNNFQVFNDALVEYSQRTHHFDSKN